MKSIVKYGLFMSVALLLTACNDDDYAVEGNHDDNVDVDEAPREESQVEENMNNFEDDETEIGTEDDLRVDDESE